MLESCVVGSFATGRWGNIVGGEVVSFDTVGVQPHDGSWVGFLCVGWFDNRNSIARSLEGERDAGALVWNLKPWDMISFPSRLLLIQSIQLDPKQRYQLSC